MSSAYHPQIDGQTERLNQCLETYLRCFVQSCPSKWDTWLSLAEYWYNTSFHSALGKTLFEVLYGYAPSHFGIVSSDACTVLDLQQWLNERSAMTQLIQHNLHRAQQRMKHQEDKHHQERESPWVIGCMSNYSHMCNNMWNIGWFTSSATSILGLISFFNALEQLHTNCSYHQPSRYIQCFMFIS